MWRDCNLPVAQMAIMRHENGIIIDEPIGYFNPDSGLFHFTEKWVCLLSGGRQALVAHPGATSDGASVPIETPFSPRWGSKVFAPAALHDLLYSAELLPREQCDREFYRMLGIYKFPAWQRYAYYYAVRAFGWWVWRRHTRESILMARQFAEIVGDVAPLDPLMLQQLEATA